MAAKTKSKGNNNRELAKEKRREQILRAASKIFAKKGYHHTSVSEVVGKCGMAQGTFYLYFKNKRDVFEALLDEFTGNVYRAFFIPGAEEVKTKEQLSQRLLAAAQSAIEMLISNKDLARIFLVEAAAREPGFDPKVAAFYERITTNAAANMKQWMDRGLLRRADPAVIAHCVVAMTERVTMQWMNGVLNGDIESIAEEIVKFELSGILAK